jgi:uncharacterized UBP type Zn finger protein
VAIQQSLQQPRQRLLCFSRRIEEETEARGERPIALKDKEADMAVCTHLDQIEEVTPKTSGCEECLKSGDTWVHLRMCMTCGHVGCCDSSKNKHATAHFKRTTHPIVKSLEDGEDWMWCFVDEELVG